LYLPQDGSPAVLNMREDMYLQGERSLVCLCERSSPYQDPKSPLYNPNLPDCTPSLMTGYTAQFTPNDPPGTGPSLQGVAAGQQPQSITYRVHVPYGYQWDGAPFRMCDPNRMRQNEYINYQPPFIKAEHFKVVNEGMYQAVTIEGGTATKAQLGFISVAGKTGTAEYCDEVARPKGLCVPGGWPAHAWYFGYAPYDANQKPEVAIIAFVYNGDEGSANALPVVKRLMYCFLNYKAQRNSPVFNGQIVPCNWNSVDATKPG
jgi:Penicillin binding protein transpeptidase domain